MQSLVYVGQLGFTLVTPVVGCTAAAAWLVSRFALPSAIIFIGLVLGLGTAAVAFKKFAGLVQRSAEREDKHDTE